MQDGQPIRPRGRPRLFDEQQVLDDAVALFSQVGFSAAAVSDLAAATGLSVGSIYKAYRDKEGVFGKALKRYIAVRDAVLDTALARRETGRERIEAVLHLYAALSQGEEGRRGCMVVAGVSEIDLIGEDAAATIRTVLGRRRDMLADLVAVGQADGSIASASPPALVADLLLNLIQGMRVVGKGGLFPADADALIDLALRVLD